MTILLTPVQGQIIELCAKQAQSTGDLQKALGLNSRPSSAVHLLRSLGLLEVVGFKSYQVWDKTNRVVNLYGYTGQKYKVVTKGNNVQK